MIARRAKKVIIFTLSGLEQRVLERAIRSLVKNYKFPPDEIDEKATAVWYSSRGCQTARMSAGEAQEWLKQIHGLRMSRIDVLKKCLRQLARRKPGQFTMRVRRPNAETLMVALNDHRLWLAAHNDIGEMEMVMHSFSYASDLPPSQKSALREIEFLAYLVDELLQFLQGSA